MNQSANKFKQLNAFAMQYGIALGAWGILSLVTTGVSLKITSLSLLSSIVTLASPVIAALLTSRFRKSTPPPKRALPLEEHFCSFSQLGSTLQYGSQPSSSYTWPTGTMAIFSTPTNPCFPVLNTPEACSRAAL